MEPIYNDFPKMSIQLNFNKFTTANINMLCAPNLGPLNVRQKSQIPEDERTKCLVMLIDRHMRRDLHTKEIIR